MANYPTSASTDANLYVAVNSKATVLAGALTSSGGNNGADIEVTDTTGFPSTGFITIDQEAIAYTSILSGPPRFSGITRGADGTTATAHSSGATVKHNVIAAHHNVLKEEVKAVETDLVAVTASITPVTATNTATSILNRIAMIVNQIKVGFGLTNWYDTLVEAVRISGNQTIAGIKDFTGQLLGKGTATNDNAATGYIGEYVSATSGLINTAATTTYGDLASISLTAGDWDVTGVVVFNLNTGTGVTTSLFGISTTAGDSAAGLTIGNTRIDLNPPTSATDNGATLGAVRMSFSTTTTVYLKYRSDYTGGQTRATGRLSARRVR